MCTLNHLSYGLSGRAILRELSKLATVSLFPIGQISDVTDSEKPIIVQALENAKKWDYTAPCIKLWHQHQLGDMPRCGMRVGMPVFELDRFSDLERHSLASCDRLIVCSHWAKRLCEEQLDVPVFVAPLGVDSTVFKPTKPKNDIFTILCLGKTEIRKGYDLVPAIIKAAHLDNFLLRVSWGNPFLKPSEVAEWENYYRSELGDKVEFVPRLPQSELVDLISSSHVLLSPTRAEGFHLPAAEALSCGTHVIVTNYSAHTEFCNASNASLIDVESMSPAYDGIWFDGKVGRWANPSVKHAAELLRNTYEIWRAGDLYQNIAGIETAKVFSWENTARKIMGAIN